ncbi:MAG TPA: DNA primase [Myxococcota bacterium]|nr:DNA primase [Myxococcota bacterium]
MSLDLKDLVKSKLTLSSIVKKTVELRGSAKRFLGLCPFHQEKTPSFQVRDDVGFYKCFGCGASGDMIEFLMRLRGLSFKEAVLELADEAGLTPSVKSSTPSSTKEPISEIVLANNIAHKYFMEQLRAKSTGLDARRYLLKERKLNVMMIKQAQIGFGGNNKEDFIGYLRQHKVSTECAILAGLLKQGPFSLTSPFINRIIFPIRTNNGRVVAFGGRSFLSSQKDIPKYVNTHGNALYEKKKILYGLFESRSAIEKGQVPCLVEGYFDAMAMWAVGIPALALCGTALSVEHARMLKRLSSRLLIALDQDGPGFKALKAALVLLYNEQIQSHVIVLTKKDPGEYLISEELSLLTTHAAKPLDALCYAIDQMSLGANSDIASRVSQIDELLPVLKSIARPLIRRQYVVYLANKLHEDPSLLWKEIEARKKTTANEKTTSGAFIHEPELSEHERLLAPIFLKFPELINEPAPLFSSLVSERFLNYFLGLKDEEIGHRIRKAGEEGVSLTLEEAKAVIEALNRKAQQKAAKVALTKQRQKLQQAEKDKDFSLMLQSLREHSQVLAENKAKKVLKPKAEVQTKAKKGYINKREEISTNAFEEEGWY